MTPKLAKSIRNTEPEICPRQRRSNTERKAPANKRNTRVRICTLQVPNEPCATHVHSFPSHSALALFSCLLSSLTKETARAARAASEAARENMDTKCSGCHDLSCSLSCTYSILTHVWLMLMPRALILAFWRFKGIGKYIWIIIRGQGTREMLLSYSAVSWCVPSIAPQSNTVQQTVFLYSTLILYHPCCDPSSVLLIFERKTRAARY